MLSVHIRLRIASILLSAHTTYIFTIKQENFPEIYPYILVVVVLFFCVVFFCVFFAFFFLLLLNFPGIQKRAIDIRVIKFHCDYIYSLHLLHNT